MGGGHLLHSIAKEEEKRERTYSDLTLFKRLIAIFKFYPKESISVIAIIITSSIFTILVPIVIQITIDRFIYPNYQEYLSNLFILSGIYTSFVILSFLLLLARTIFFAKLGQRIINRLRNDVFIKLQYLSSDYFTEVESGRTISKVTNDIDALDELLATGIIDIFADIVGLVTIVIIMFTYNVPLTLLTFSVIPLLLIITIYFQKRVRAAYRRTRVAIAKVTANLQETISSAKVTKALSREEDNIKTFNGLNKETFSANVEAAGISALFLPVIQVIATLGSVIILLYGGYAAITQGTITIGVLYLFLDYSGKFFMPIISLFTFYTAIQSGFAAAERIFEIIDEEPSIKNDPNPIRPSEIRGNIELKSVNFYYTSDVKVLDDINLTISQGQSVALVGHTGAGKTTITKLLSRYYDITTGELLIDGMDIRKIDLEILRKNIAVVPQDVFLFSGTIMENLKFGNKEISDDEVYRICEILGLHQFILNLTDGYFTDVKEGGSRLSLGQRQLISLARAILANPRILILDECSSSVDTITEALIQKGINFMLQGRTSIIIAHRLSTIKSATKIVVLDQGKLIESGTHEELFKAKGKYYSLYQTQQTSNTLD